MREYPSIDLSIGQRFTEIQGAHLWDKLDGRQVRMEYSRKRGWEKWGTKHCLFDEREPDYGVAILIFRHDLEDPLTRVIRKQGWDRVVAFCELWQSSSLGGCFVQNEPKHLTVLDLAPDDSEHRNCLLESKKFLKLLDGVVPIPYYLGQANWTRGFIDRVWRRDVLCITFEGIVGKSGTGKRQVMAKAKTKEWHDAIIKRYGEEEGRRIAES